MKKITPFGPLKFQVAVTVIMLCAGYLWYTLANIEEPDLVNMVSYLIIEPLYGLVISVLTVALCFAAGLPIRLYPQLFSWWASRPVIQVMAIVLGVLLIAVSFLPFLKEPAEVIIMNEKEIIPVPNHYILYTGWWISAFSLLHFYPGVLTDYLNNKWGMDL